MQTEYDILPLLSPHQIASGSGQRNMICPVCQCPNSHVQAPYMYIDDKWHGNGVLAVTPLEGECGSKWQVCIGSHKGDAPIFVRVVESCHK